MREAHEYNQKVVQPTCVKNGREFSHEYGLCSSEVAPDRSGNKRAVILENLANLLTNEVHSRQ